jgi:hypothetical protein
MLFPRITSALECFCGKSYTSPQDLEEHRRARGHFPSHRCTSLCKHPIPTPKDGPAHVCGGCGKTCERFDIFLDHAIATGHCFCSDCDLTFPSSASWEEHRKSAKHASEFRCCDCKISFKDVHALVAHMENRAHRKPLRSKSPRHDKNRSMSPKSGTKCTKCERKFSCSKALKQHYDSVKHKPLSRLKCPMGTNCKGTFTSPSALLHHLESGRCSSGMHREKVFQILKSCNLNIISQCLSTSVASPSFSPRSYTPSIGIDSWTAISDNGSEWSMLTPSPSCDSAQDGLDQWSLLEDVDFQLGEGMFVGTTNLQTLRCPICPGTRARFSTLHSLQQHVESPAHSPKIYQCPSLSQDGDVTRRAGHFSTLGGLCQHLESNSCRGGKSVLLRCTAFIQEHLEQLGHGKIHFLLPSEKIPYLPANTAN